LTAIINLKLIFNKRMLDNIKIIEQEQMRINANFTAYKIQLFYVTNSDFRLLFQVILNEKTVNKNLDIWIPVVRIRVFHIKNCVSFITVA